MYAMCMPPELDDTKVGVLIEYFGVKNYQELVDPLSRFLQST